MKVTYTGPSADIDLGFAEVARGESIEVSDEVGESLLESGDWTAAKASKKTTTTEDES
jgi:hypothetical protein